MANLSEAMTSLQITSTTALAKPTEDASLLATSPVIDPLFQDPDADITFCSADGTHFQLQRRFLETNTGAFPGSEFDTHGEVVHLTESEKVLRILFGFVHPRRHPDVEVLSFPLLAGVAEAAEKYEVFSAINVCKMQMRHFVSTNPTEILAHATKHDHPTLIKEVAPHLARLPLMQIVRELPPQYVVSWIEYRTAWDSMFENAAKFVLNAGVSNRNRLGGYFSTSLSLEMCYSCKVATLAMIQELKELLSLPELKEALGKPRPVLMTCLAPSCSYKSIIPNLLEEMKTKIDALSVFPIPSAPPS